MEGNYLSSQERKTIQQTNNNPTKEARVYIQELGTYLYVTMVQNSPSVLSLGLCDELGFSHSWEGGGTNKGKKTITCCTDDFVPHVAVTHQKVSSPGKHDPARINLCKIQKWRKPRRNCGNPSLKVQKQRCSIGQATTSIRTRSWERSYCAKQDLPRL